MRIRSIELAGESKTTLHDGTPGLPGILARIAPARDADYVEVTFLSPGGEQKHLCRADDPDDMWSMAECLQERLDGQPGTNGDVNGYYRLLEYFAN